MIERLTKISTIAAVVLAIVLHLFVDPADGWISRLLAITMFGAAFVGARRWPSATMATALAILPLGPALLTHLLRVAALNLFYTVLLSGLVGAIVPGVHRDRWSMPRSWALLLGTWALTISLAWPVMIVREAGLRLGTLRDVGALDTWAMLTTPQVESWILYVVITQLVGVLWLDWLFAHPPNAEESNPTPMWGLLLGATLASVVAIYQGTIDLRFLSGGIWPDLQRAAGTLLDANAYGTVAAFAGPLAFVSIPSLRVKHARMAQAAALAVNWGGAWMSGSRTAFVCGALGTLLLVYESLRARNVSDDDTRALRSLLAGVAAAVLALITVAGAVGPLRRFVAGTNVTATELWSRGGYGTVATKMIRDYPLIGVGVGSFNWMASDYWRTMAHDRLPFDNAQNWWRHQVAELGLLGSLPIIAWSLIVAWLVFTRRTPADRRIEVATLRGLLIGLGLASMLGVPTQNPIVLLLFLYLVARFETLTNPRTVEPRIPAAAWLAGAILAIVYASGHLVLARGPLKPVTRAENTNRDYVIGTYPTELLPQGSFRWTGKRATFALGASSRYVVIRFHVEHPDVATHPVKVRISTRCQTLVDEFRADSYVDGRALELPEGEKRILLDTEVSRTWRPSDYGKNDDRDLGLSLEVDFVATPAVVSSQERWIPVKPCA